jgi:pyrimidine deaminase RibD-like protein
VVCILVKGGNVISIAWNLESQHAEQGAINRAWRHGTKGLTAYVFRFHKDGSPALAKPCKACQIILKNAGIKRVMFSVDAGDFSINDFNGYSSLTPMKAMSL